MARYRMTLDYGEGDRKIFEAESQAEAVSQAADWVKNEKGGRWPENGTCVLVPEHQENTEDGFPN